MENRTYNLGASEIAGLLKEYAGTLLNKNKISEELFNKLNSMEDYLETRYSLNKKLKLTALQKEEFRDFTSNAFTTRGKETEELIKNVYLQENNILKVVESQTRKEKVVEGCQFPLVAVIDYRLDNGSILEIKSKSDNQYIWDKIQELDYSVYIQVQVQMWLHEINNATVFFGAINSVKNEDKTTFYKVIDTKEFKINGLDQELIQAIIQSIKWFSYEFDKGTLDNKEQDQKKAKDLLVDEFLTKDAETLRITANAELSAKIARLKEIESIAKEFDKLEKEITEEIRKNIAGNKRALIVSNEYQIEASYSKASFHTEETIIKALEKAKSIKIGDQLSPAKLIKKFK